MNRLIIIPLLALELCLCSCAPSQRQYGSRPGVNRLLHFTATVDGSGRIVFTGESARYEHKHWSPPWNVTLNGEAWTDLSQSPTGWKAAASQLDLCRARLVERTGRDVIALEPTAAGFDLYLSDTPNGAADYTVTIAIPVRP